MVYRNKGKFELKESILKDIVDDILKQPNNQDVVIRVEKSPNKKSNSLYVKLFIGDYSTALRISDHNCKGAIRNVFVSESTGIANIYYKIEKTIKDLRLKRLYGLLNKGAK